jgi:hypothetical protein
VVTKGQTGMLFFTGVPFTGPKENLILNLPQIQIQALDVGEGSAEMLLCFAIDVVEAVSRGQCAWVSLLVCSALVQILSIDTEFFSRNTGFFSKP